MLTHQITPFTIQDLLYFPVLILILTLLYKRNKIGSISDFVIKLNEDSTTNLKLFLFFSFIVSFYFLISLFISYITFPYSDVDNAMSSAIYAYFKLGLNPYSSNVVQHIFINVNGNVIVLGTYNYGPIDLLCYGIGYFLFSPLVGSSWWLYLSNVLLSGILYVIIGFIIQIPDRIKIGPYVLFSMWFLQDNVFLMVIFLALAWLVYLKISSSYKHLIVVIILTLGVFTKLYIAFVLVAYFIFVLKDNLRLWIANFLAVLVTSILIISPFGVWNVINSLFIFQINLNIRANFATIQGGIPRYLEFFNINWINIPLSLFLVLVFLAISEKYARNQINVKFTLFTLLTLSLLPVSGYEFYIIPGFFMLIDYYQNFKIKYLNKIKSIQQINYKSNLASLS